MGQPTIYTPAEAVDPCRFLKAEPCAVLRFLMEQHGLKQLDLVDRTPQNRISKILSGQHTISQALAKQFATPLHVPVDVFL